ncbi:MAG: hypothetical protein EPN91_08185 [Salinibacterium sp.]|nr:MAG: hypothetical protein EPN91_08185 [Salinibacterium sp.]
MNITITRSEQLELSTSEVEEVADKWLDEQVGNHFMKDTKLYRRDDYGHHRGGTHDVRIDRVTSVPKVVFGNMNPSEEMSAYRYDFIVACIYFRNEHKMFKEAKKSDK